MLPQVPQRERVGRARRMFAALREAELAFEVLYLGVAMFKILLSYAKFRHLRKNNEKPLLRQQLYTYLRFLFQTIQLNCMTKNKLPLFISKGSPKKPHVYKCPMIDCYRYECTAY